MDIESKLTSALDCAVLKDEQLVRLTLREQAFCRMEEDKLFYQKRLFLSTCQHKDGSFHCWYEVPNIQGAVGFKARGFFDTVLLTEAKNKELLEALVAVQDCERHHESEANLRDALGRVEVILQRDDYSESVLAVFGEMKEVRLDVARRYLAEKSQLNLSVAARNGVEEVAQVEGDEEVALCGEMNEVTHSTADSTTAAHG